VRKMKRKLLDILCCPKCKGELTLSVKKESSDEIEEGTLKCERCSRIFPIEEGIPNLLLEED